jgi:hypothetical protein
MSTAVITTTANGSTAQTAGNAAISGTFSANVFVTNTFQVNSAVTVGNSVANVTINSTSFAIANSSANLTLTAPTASQSANGQYFLNANGSYALVVSSLLSTNTVTTTGTTTQNVDSWSITTYRSAEYQLNVWDNVANNHMALKLLVTHDTANPYVTEFATMLSNGSMGTFSAAIVTGNLNVQFTPVSSNTTVRFSRVAI